MRRIRFTWKRLSDLSTIEWLVGFAPKWVLSSVGAGLLVVWGAVVSLPAPVLVLLLIAGFVVVYGGITIWEIRRAQRARLRPGQLYLSTTEDRRPDPWKTYHIEWSPTDYFGIRFSNKPPLAPGSDEERAFVLYLFNSGPDDARHIRITWEIRGLNVCAAVERARLFEGFIDELSPSHLILQSDNRGSERPLSHTQEQVVPLLRSGETVKIESPAAFNGAAAIAYLALAKAINAKKPDTPQGGFAAVMGFIRLLERPMTPIDITVRYDATSGHNVQRHQLIGVARANATMRQRRDQNNAWEPDPDGVSVSLNQLMVVDR